MDKSKLKKIGKKALVGIGAGLAAASLFVHSVFPGQKEILIPPEEPPAIEYVQTEEETGREKTPQLGRGKRLKERLRASLRRLPPTVRLLLLLPLWISGALLCVLWQRLLLPAAGLIVKPLLTLAVLCVLLLAGMKLLFPELTLRRMLCRKNATALAVFAVICITARVLTKYCYPEKTLLPAFVCLAAGLLFFAAAAMQYSVIARRAAQAAGTR